MLPALLSHSGEMESNYYSATLNSLKCLLVSVVAQIKPSLAVSRLDNRLTDRDPLISLRRVPAQTLIDQF